MNDHLDFNTDFLNNPASSKNQGPSNDNQPKNGGSKKGWIIAAIIFGILIVIGAMEDSGSTGSTYTPSTNSTYGNTSNSADHSLVFDGQTFRCSDYHYDKAMALRPDATLSAQIDSESAALDLRISSLDAEAARIDGMYVDEYSQWSIDNYNAAVDAYNVKKNRLQADIDSWNLKNTSFNRKIDAYNNYLDTNCRPQ